MGVQIINHYCSLVFVALLKMLKCFSCRKINPYYFFIYQGKDSKIFSWF